MVTMHGFFDLQDEPSEPEIQRAFDDFVSHLKECELNSSHKVMRRSPNENYIGTPFSQTAVHNLQVELILGAVDASVSIS